MPSQLELIALKAPKVERFDVDFFIGRLKGWGEWWTARELRDRFGYQDRELRAIANASKGAILSGQHGYKLNTEATEDERRHAAAWLRHQGRAMLKRADEIETFKP